VPAVFRRVLVSFGGEDPAGLALPLARDLIRLGLVEAQDLTLVSGALRKGGPPVGLEGVMILGPVQDLKEHLAGYDLVLTQFGLTAFEAAWAGCGVILLNPSLYHRALSEAAGFPDVGIGRADPKLLKRWLGDVEGVLGRLRDLMPQEPESLAARLETLSVSGPLRCPVCGSRERAALHRNEGRSYFRCLDCGMVYLTRFGSKRSAPYTKDYFFEEYRRQYGRTYLDDWPALTGMADARLAIIESLALQSLGRSAGLSLLDVGCAYGPCMAAAKARGHEPYGLDISPDAARYVREELDLPAIAGDFADPATAGSFGGPFDCLSMWYVIEHFEDLDTVLRNAAALLRPKGILALSTPSGEGISARQGRGAFFEASPEDHFTIWEPSRVASILALHGFRLERLKVTGHHPERFPLAKAWGAIPGGGPLARLLLAVIGLYSRFFGLGDTFEIYASRSADATETGRGGTRDGAKPANRVGGKTIPTRPRSGDRRN
jgi:2-polyprenyl-3-methyl-5-hydroxy-6-metoxy-1,4-benzoquinol methylase